MGGIILFIMPFIFRLSYDDFVLLLKTETNTINSFFFFKENARANRKLGCGVFREMNLGIAGTPSAFTITHRNLLFCSLLSS